LPAEQHGLKAWPEHGSHLPPTFFPPPRLPIAPSPCSPQVLEAIYWLVSAGLAAIDRTAPQALVSATA
jgi:hypothetical protein